MRMFEERVVSCYPRESRLLLMPMGMYNIMNEGHCVVVLIVNQVSHRNVINMRDKLETGLE